MSKEDRIKQKISELAEIFGYDLDNYHCEITFNLKDKHDFKTLEHIEINSFDLLTNNNHYLDWKEYQEELYRQVSEDI